MPAFASRSAAASLRIPSWNQTEAGPALMMSSTCAGMSLGRRNTFTMSTGSGMSATAQCQKPEPVGASGLRQVYELVNQLRGRGGDRQVQDATVGYAQLYGAPGTAAVTILSR